MRVLVGFFWALWCMSIHRNQEMVHISGWEHEIFCRTCGERMGSWRNWFLTAFYFSQSVIWLPAFLLVIPASLIHKAITRQEGHFIHPPEHRHA